MENRPAHWALRVIKPTAAAPQEMSTSRGAAAPSGRSENPNDIEAAAPSGRSENPIDIGAADPQVKI